MSDWLEVTDAADIEIDGDDINVRYSHNRYGNKYIHFNKSLLPSEWISVDDRLPMSEEEMGDRNYYEEEFIIATKHFVTHAYFAAGATREFWCQFRDYSKEEVTHWQPLPEPPS